MPPASGPTRVQSRPALSGHASSSADGFHVPVPLVRPGELLRTLARHRGPIFSLKWNKSMDALLSGSVDRTAIVWDPATGDVRQQFEFHSGAWTRQGLGMPLAVRPDLVVV